MMQLIFATHNTNKAAEVNKLISNVQIITLDEAGLHEEIPEPWPTLEENAFAKSKYIYQKTGKHCFSEDTGLEIPALNGEPGVKSARYAGDQCDTGENIKKLLEKLSDKEDRTGKFRTIISLIVNKVEYRFEGVCEGSITYEPKGVNGFGYDPVFIPEGSLKTFAEMSIEEKNKFSHRKKAVAKMVSFINQLHDKINN